MHYGQQNQLQYLSSFFHTGQHRSIAPPFCLTLESQCWLAEYFDKQRGAASVFGGVPPALSGCLFKCELSYSPALQENMFWTSPDLTSLLFVLLGLVWPLFAIIALPILAKLNLATPWRLIEFTSFLPFPEAWLGFSKAIAVCRSMRGSFGESVHVVQRSQYHFGGSRFSTEPTRPLFTLHLKASTRETCKWLQQQS